MKKIEEREKINLKPPKCIVHIGAPKTGSTALQKYLTDNRGALKENGFLYCETGLRGWGHHDIAFLIHGEYPEWATIQNNSLELFIDKFKEEVAEHPGTIILSSENFYIFPNPSGLRQFLEKTGMSKGRDVELLVYVRPQDEAHESWYNQTIKAQGYVHTIEECISKFHSLWDYSYQLKLWADEFGNDSIIARCYEYRETGYTDVIGDLLEYLELDPQEFPHSNGYINTRINRDILEFQRIINGLIGTPQEKRRLHKYLMELTANLKGTGVFNESPSISTAERHVLMEEYKEGNSEVAKTYFGRDRLFQKNPDNNGLCADYEGLSVKKFFEILDWISVCRDKKDEIQQGTINTLSDLNDIRESNAHDRR